MENGPGMKMYFLLKNGDVIPASYVIVYQRVFHDRAQGGPVLVRRSNLHQASIIDTQTHNCGGNPLPIGFMGLVYLPTFTIFHH